MSSLEERRKSAREPVLSGSAAGTDQADNEPSIGFFPVRPFKYCPGSFLIFIPASFTVVQDWTQVTLVVGVFGSTCVCLTVLLRIYQWDFHIVDILTLAYVAPCVVYFFRVLSSYEERLFSMQKDVEQKFAELSKAYIKTIGDMDVLLGQSMESSAYLAERSFESHRRNFLRFLMQVNSLNDYFNEANPDTSEFLKQFRGFVEQWLTIFNECSVDPMNDPRSVVTSDELDRCTTLGEITSLLTDRIKAIEIRFITTHANRDRDMLDKMHDEARRIQGSAAMGLGATNTTMQMALVLLAWREYARNSKQARQQATQGEGSANDFMDSRARGDFGFKDGDEEQGGYAGFMGCSWLQCGSGLKPGPFHRPDEDGFPRTLRFGCGILMLLSRTHVVLLMLAVAAVVILCIDLFARSPPFFRDLVGVALTEACLVVLLVRFEEVDEVQKLKSKLLKLETEKDLAEDRKREMTEFWEQMQRLTDLWLHRTVPRLELIKEVQGYLLDAKDQDLPTHLCNVNSALDGLNKTLGDLELWCTDGVIGQKTKKWFGDQMIKVCQARDLGSLVGKLQAVKDESKKKVRASIAAPGT